MDATDDNSASMHHAVRRWWAIPMVVVGALSTSMGDAAAGDQKLLPAIEAALIEKGFDSETWSVIGNLLHHEASERPVGVDAAIMGLLQAPSRIADRAGSLASDLRRDAGVDEIVWRSVLARRPVAGGDVCPIEARRLSAVVDWYVDQLDAIDSRLEEIRRSCADGNCAKVSTFVAALTDDATFRQIFANPAVVAGAQRVSGLAPSFLAVQARLLACLKRLPPVAYATAVPEYRPSRWGGIVIGSGGDDVYHSGDAAVILDLGGDDHYRFKPLPPGRLRVVIDLGGHDSYQGADPAFLSVSALVDLAGNDLYVSPGPGQAATVGGLSLLVDRNGDDAYKAASFGQGAAALGIAVLIDGGGEDRYRLGSYGQGYGGPRGLGVLWELGGDDSYVATGTTEIRDGRGRPSFAQGAGRGLRRGIGGGTGLLLDDSGDDTYDADLFAQGSGYYFAFGMLRDDGGRDRYQARRYAQGAGAHAAVGVLADRAGDDVYTATVGVSQGMGLDVSVGFLRDDGGDDTYDAGWLAQGAGTGNGIGMVVDSGGLDRFVLGSSGWGQDHWLRGLPGPSFLLGAESTDSFTLMDRTRVFDAIPRAGPHASLPPRDAGPDRHACPIIPSPEAAGGLATAVDPLPLLRQSAPVFGTGDGAIAAYRTLAASLPQAFPHYMAAIPETEFDAAVSLMELVRCWIPTASDEAAIALRRLLAADLTAPIPHPRPWMIGYLLSRLPGTVEERRPAVEALSNHPSCGARSRAVDLVRTALTASDPLPLWVQRLVDNALAGDCWRLHAATLRLLDGRPELADSTRRMMPRVPGFLSRPRPAGVKPRRD